MTKQTSLRITFGHNVLTVQAGTVGNPGNRKFKNESALWYAIKQELMAHHKAPDGKPFELVKKIMSKDGLLVGGDEGPYYLRDKKHRFCIYDRRYALRDIAQDLHKAGVIVLAVERWSV